MPSLNLQTRSDRTAERALRGFGQHRQLRWAVIETLEIRLVMTASLPLIDVSLATTKDSDSVTVDYSIGQSRVAQPLTFDVYRSDSPTLESSSVLLGATTLNPSANSTALGPGAHVLTLVQGTVLAPNPAQPFVIVVADQNGTVAEDPASTDNAYFHALRAGCRRPRVGVWHRHADLGNHHGRRSGQYRPLQ